MPGGHSAELAAEVRLDATTGRHRYEETTVSCPPIVYLAKQRSNTRILYLVVWSISDLNQTGIF